MVKLPDGTFPPHDPPKLQEAIDAIALLPQFSAKELRGTILVAFRRYRFPKGGSRDLRPKPGDSFNEVKKALKALEKAHKHLKNSHTIYWMDDSIYDPPRPSEHNIENEWVERIEKVLQQEINNIRDKITEGSSKIGTPSKAHVDKFVVELKEIYEKFSGEKATTVKQIVDGNMTQWPKFQIFARKCLAAFDVRELEKTKDINQFIFNAIRR